MLQLQHVQSECCCLVKQLRETAGSEPHYQCNNEEMWHVILLHVSYVRSKYVSIIDLICFNYHTRTLYQPKPNFIWLILTTKNDDQGTPWHRPYKYDFPVGKTLSKTFTGLKAVMLFFGGTIIKMEKKWIEKVALNHLQVGTSDRQKLPSLLFLFHVHLLSLWR